MSEQVEPDLAPWNPRRWWRNKAAMAWCAIAAALAYPYAVAMNWADGGLAEPYYWFASAVTLTYIAGGLIESLGWPARRD